MQKAQEWQQEPHMSFLSWDNLRSLLAAISSQTIASTTHSPSSKVINHQLVSLLRSKKIIIMIPSDLLLQYFHAAQCHLHDLQSSASSSTSLGDDDDDNDDDSKNNMNNNLLTYHRNLIVQVQQVALDEVIEAWQKSRQERTEMVSDNNDSNFIVVVTRESVLSVLRQIGCDDYSSIIYVRGMTASSCCNNNDEGMLMSLSLVDKEQQQQRTSITAAMEQTNEIARLVYTRLVLSSVAAAAATSSSSSSSNSSSSGSDDVKRIDNNNSKDDDESPLDETTIYDYLAVAMTAVRLPEVKQYLHYYNDGHSNADSISLLSFLHSTKSSMKCSQDDGVGQEVSSSSQKHIINKKEQRLQYIQRLCWHAVLGVQSNIEHHDYAMNYVQYILEFEFGSGTVTGADKKKYDYSSQLLTTLAEYRTIMSTALIVDVTINITTSASSNLKGDGNEEEASSSTAAQREQLLLPSNECDDGTTRIVGVSYSEFIIDGGNSRSSSCNNNDNNGVPRTNVINEHEIIRSRNEFHIKRLQQSIINDYNILSASQREETIVEATAVYNKLIIDMENVISEKERVQLLQNMTTDEQRLLVIYKAIASNVIRNM